MKRLACLLLGHRATTLYAPVGVGESFRYVPETWCLRCLRQVRS